MLNIREPIVAWDFKRAVTRRLMLWDKQMREAERSHLAAAMWGGGSEPEAVDDDEVLSAIPTYSGGVNGR